MCQPVLLYTTSVIRALLAFATERGLINRVDMLGYRPEEVAVTVGVALFVLQYIGRQTHFRWIKISFYLGHIVDLLRAIAWGLGVVYGYIATFPSLIQFWEIYNTFYEMVIPVWDLLHIPIDYHDAVIETARKVASVEHMRTGTVVLVWLGFMWRQGYLTEIYFGMIGVMVGMMILTHLVTKAVSGNDTAVFSEDEIVAEQTTPRPTELESPPPRRRATRQRTRTSTELVPRNLNTELM